ncbi:plasmid mobilization relaxosome protein MobC [Erysipelotrichaceae bacterium 7770_A6]|nr:plasmid mobilization relaxosome protein MobC [Erysipelotrichaceae bacterium 7770_A6]
MTCRLNDEEYEKVLIKISKSGLSKQEYILSCILNKRISEKLDLDFYKLINEINHVGNNLNQISRILNSKNPILENEVLENQRMVNAVLTNLNHQIKGAGNGNN